MAHGSGRYVACFSCKKYTHVSRFSKDPVCPTCGEAGQQTTPSEMIDKFHLWGGFQFGYPTHWDWFTEEDIRP